MLFDRLSDAPLPDLREQVRASLERLVTSRHVRDPSAPAGILNFGLPHVIDVDGSSEALDGYCQRFAERIRLFEPRLQLATVRREGRSLVVEGCLVGDDAPQQWRLGGVGHG